MFSMHAVRDNWAVRVFALIVLILVLRAPERVLHGYLWAEDATVFLKAAHELGFRSVVDPYAGYLLVVPRLVAWLHALTGDLDTAPHAYVAICVVLSALGGAYLYGVVFAHTGDRLTAVLVAVAPFLIVQSGEVFCNLTNLQWILALVLLALIGDLFALQQSSNVALASKTVAMVLITLTGPFGVFFAPVVLAALVLHGRESADWRRMVPAAAYALAVGVQLWVASGAVSAMAPVKPHAWLSRLVFDFAAQQMLPGFMIRSEWGAYAAWTVAILLLVFVALCARYTLLACALVMYAVTLWALGVIRVNDPATPMGPMIGGERYYFIPTVFLAWALVLGLRAIPRPARVVPIVILVLMMMMGVVHFRMQQYPKWEITHVGNGVHEVLVPPNWRAQVRVKSSVQH